MIEDLSLIGKVEQDIPLNQKVGMLDILSRVVQNMNPEQLSRYQAVADQVRQKLAPMLPRDTMVSGL